MGDAGGSEERGIRIAIDVSADPVPSVNYC